MKNDARKKLTYATVAGFVAGAGAIGLTTQLPWGEDTPDITPVVEVSDTSEAELKTATEDLARLTDVISTRDQEIDTLKLELDAMSSEVAMLTEQLTTSQAAIEAAEVSELNQQEINSRLADLTATIAERDATIDELNKSINEMETQLAEVADGTISPQAAMIEQRDSTIAELELALAELDSELDGIKSGEIQLETVALDDTGAGKISDISVDGTNVELASLKRNAAADGQTIDQLKSEIASFEAILAAAKADRKTDSGPYEMPLSQVHFESGSSTLTIGGQTRALAAVQAIIEMNLEKVRVYGHADTVGSSEYNMKLSRARAESVADVFVRAGLPREMIEVAGMGEAENVLPVSTADGISEPLNRCVGIYPVSVN